MARIVVTDQAGRTETIEAKSGLSVMENLRNSGVEGILAICGGSCSCATCHIHVDPDWWDKLEPRDEDETELVSETDHYRTHASRLSCQIDMRDDLDGLTLTVAPED